MTGASYNNERSFSGKKVVPILAIGFVALAAIFGFGTFGLANLMSPWLTKHRPADEKAAIQRMEQREEGRPLVR